MNKQTIYRIGLIIIGLTLVLVTVGCGFNFKLPVVTKVEIVPEQTVEIQVPSPADGSTGVELVLEFAVGEINLSPGASEVLVSGNATYNAVELEPQIESTGSVYTLQSGNLDMDTFPAFSDEVKNVWDLKLASTPMSLDIKAGAYEGNFEFGGLSLEKFTVQEGGSQCIVNFSTPNGVEMSSFSYSTGGSKVTLKGLANANFTQMTFNSGAGDYTLSFEGELKRDAAVSIDSGMGNMNIIIPTGVDAKITFDGSMTTVNAGDGWVQNDTVYTHAGSGPTITMTLTMGAGTLNLKSE